MRGPLQLLNVRPLDLATGLTGEPTTLHIAGDQVRRSPTPGARTVDAQGAILLPGLWDAHVHMDQWATSSRWLDVSAADSALEVAAIVSEKLDTITDDVVVGFGFRDATWPLPPTAAALDAVTGTRPCVLISGDVHSVWVNSAAIQAFGLDPACGGVLREGPAFDLQTRLQQVDDDTLDRWVGDAATRAAERGVVGIVDMTMGWNVGAWQRRFDAGFGELCVRPATYPDFLDRFAQEGWRGGQLLDDDRLLEIGPLKVISDGSLGSGSAWCHEPYGVDHTHGRCNVPIDELESLLARATSLGMWCAVHAIGDRALSEALEAFAQAGAHGAIEHAQLARPDDVARMAELGLRASVQPAHLLDDRETLDALWADRADHAFALKSFVKAGVELVFGSDAPVSPLDPWLAIEAAVRRSGDAREPWHPEQCLTLSEALMASTRGVRQLIPGAEADLVLLDRNPFEMPVEELHTITPVLTAVGGHITCDKL